MARTVLLADDSVTAQNMGRRILMDAGYEVITVNNGSAALKKIHENKPDLIVLDVYMPGYGGLEVCQRLKESGETMRIPVLLTVGKMEPFKSDEAKRVRADAHIVKPFEASELLAALTRLEDRIVPQSDAPGKRGGKSEGKKARFWHTDEPDNAAIMREESEKIAYLAQMKQRQAKTLVEEPAAVSEPETPQPGTTELKTKTPEPEIESHKVVTQATEVVVAPVVEVPESVDIQESQISEAETTATFASAPETEPVSIPAPEEFSVTNAPIEEVSADEIAPAPPLVEVSAVSETIAPMSAPTPSDATTQRWVAENVPLSAEEASIALEQEMQLAESAVAAREAEINQAAYAEPRSAEQEIEDPRVEEPQPEESKPEEPRIEEPKEDESEAVAAEPVTSETAGAAFAASAAAGSSAEAVVVSGDSSSPETPVVSEATAAWQNWQQIRDSVMRPQQTDGIAEAIVQAAQASAPAQEASPSSTTPSSATSALEGAALASIVDSVLAELKPKLMEEIAKKMAEKK